MEDKEESSSGGQKGVTSGSNLRSTRRKSLSITEDKVNSAKTSGEVLKNHIPEDDAAKTENDEKESDDNIENEKTEDTDLSEKPLSKDEKGKSAESDADTSAEDPKPSGESILISDETEVLKNESTVTETEEETTNIKSVDSGFPDSDDEYLKDMSLGFDDEDNLKQPLIGFSEIHEATLFPIVDKQSMMMFEIVRTLENQLMEENFASLLAHKDSLVVPRCVLLLPGGGDINLRVFEDDTPKNIDPVDKASNGPKEGSEGPISPKRVRPLALPFLEGWKREILIKPDSASGRKAGEVCYISPDNVKCWSIGQVGQYLNQYPSLELTVKNFSFAKIPIQGPKGTRTPSGGKSPTMKAKSILKNDVGMSDDMDDDYEMEKHRSPVKSSSSRRSIQPPKRYATGESVFYPDKKTKMSSKNSDRDVNDSMMEMGMLPPKYPKGKEDSSIPVLPLSAAADSQQEVRRRGRPPKPGGKKDLLVQAQAIAAAKEAAGIMSESDDSDSMFQISAFRQSHSLMEAAMEQAAMEQYQESMQEDMEMDSDSGECRNPSVPVVEENSYPGCNQNSEQLLPCSIRCSGMTGEIPTLQCKRCLCLYHPECLGLPPNLNYNSFLCSNCEGESTEKRMTPAAPPLNVKPKQSEAKKPSQESKKMGDIKKPPPPLIRANFPKLPAKFMNDMRLRLPPPQAPRPPVLQPSMSFGRGGIRMKPKLTPPQLSLLRPVSSDITMSISPISMKRGRGRPPKNSKLIPQLSRNLTITPISIPKKIPPPPVPNLHPVGPVGIFPKRPSNAKPDWLFNNPNKANFSKAMANIKSSAAVKNKQPQMNKTDKPSGTTSQILQQQKELNKEKSKTQVDNPTTPAVFRRYTQSVVTIGQKKFVVIPRNAEKSGKSPTPDAETVGAESSEESAEAEPKDNSSQGSVAPADVSSEADESANSNSKTASADCNMELDQIELQDHAPDLTNSTDKD